jgi:hypothetical protein
MQNVTTSRKRLVDFRLEVDASFTWRADALFELVDALDPTIAPREVQRVPTPSSPGGVGADQVQRLGLIRSTCAGNSGTPDCERLGSTEYLTGRSTP